MNVVRSSGQLHAFLKEATEVNTEHPVVISKFITGARELEIDAVADKGEVVCYAITEHVENAGVHSGDATMVFPPQRTYIETMRRVKTIAREIAEALQITGPFNIQFIAKDNEIKVIECNLRASRSFPFISKITKNNFIDIATRRLVNHSYLHLIWIMSV
jgi:carbamoyl-phosphate synthase large subunit